MFIIKHVHHQSCSSHVGLQGAGLFELTSTLNHSCLPNCRVSFGEHAAARLSATTGVTQDFQLKIKTRLRPLFVPARVCSCVARVCLVRCADIAEGEELLICYVDQQADRGTRREGLRGYGFECYCERCVVNAD